MEGIDAACCVPPVKVVNLQPGSNSHCKSKTMSKHQYFVAPSLFAVRPASSGSGAQGHSDGQRCASNEVTRTNRSFELQP